MSANGRNAAGGWSDWIGWGLDCACFSGPFVTCLDVAVCFRALEVLLGLEGEGKGADGEIEEVKAAILF